MNNSEYQGLSDEQISQLEWQTYSNLKDVCDIKEAARYLRLSRTISPEIREKERQELLALKRNTNNRTKLILETDRGIADNTTDLLEERLLCTSVMHSKPLSELNGEEGRYLEIVQTLDDIRRRKIRIKNTQYLLTALN